MVLSKEDEMHIEDDNVKYFKKWLKTINIHSQRYGNEILLDDDVIIICYTKENVFEIEILISDNITANAKTSYSAHKTDGARFDNIFLDYISTLLITNSLANTT